MDKYKHKKNKRKTSTAFDDFIQSCAVTYTNTHL